MRLSPAIFILLVGVAPAFLRAAPPATIDYTRQVRPILSRHCFQCHGPDDQARKAELRLDDHASATRELPTGITAISPGHPDKSELLDRVTSADTRRLMPPPKAGKALTEDEVSTLRRWIEQGAGYSRHWAYVKPRRPDLPTVSEPSWPLNGIDHFILARLDQEGLKPGPAAERHALLRRVALDLAGLAPSLEEADAFAADTRPDAYERAVDALLAKPAYGERWAAVWLDLARYGDSQGYIHDPPRTIWRWRDWLIEALNQNLPYDQFTTEMLAGDLLPQPTTAQVIATGFHRNTTNNTEGGSNGEEYRHASVVDRVNTTMQVWMGATIGCAQCHSHKYDPFTHKEYYQLFAILNTTEDSNSEPPFIDVAQVGKEPERTAILARLTEARTRLEEETKRVDGQREEWEKTVDRAALPKPTAEILMLPADQRKPEQLTQVVAHHRSLSPEWVESQAAETALKKELETVATTTLVMREGTARPTNIALRGEFNNPGELVTPGVPAALHPVPAGVKLDRLGLSRWIMDPENPLTARVAVNRLWQEVFGIGLVETSEEFGNQGEPPSHPELLDWLATEYIRLGWDTKQEGLGAASRRLVVSGRVE